MAQRGKAPYYDHFVYRPSVCLFVRLLRFAFEFRGTLVTINYKCTNHSVHLELLRSPDKYYYIHLIWDMRTCYAQW